MRSAAARASHGLRVLRLDGLLLAAVVAFVAHRLPPTPRTVRDGSGAVDDPHAPVDAGAR